MTQFKTFLSENFRMLFVLASFVITIYIQHITNTSRITDLLKKCNSMEVKIADQYNKIDAIKLDKTVFEATMGHFASIQIDLREMRADIKELLKSRK